MASAGKDLLLSKTFLGFAVAGVSLGLQLFGVSVPVDVLSATIEGAQHAASDGTITVNEVVTLLSVALGGYGRAVATQAITSVAGIKVR